MQDKEAKKKPTKAPDKDATHEPARKTAENAKRVAKRNRAKVPLFLRDTPSAPQGNLQDEKDETPE